MERETAAALGGHKLSDIAAAPAGPASLRLAEALLAASPPSAMPWHYENALLVMAAARAGRVYGSGLGSAGAAYVDALVGPDGSIAGYREADYNLDQVNPGRLLLVHPESGSPRITAAMETLVGQLARQPRCPSGAYWHKRIYPDQIWLDGLYMAGPYSIAYGRRFGKPELVDEALAQFRIAEERTVDPRSGLLRHACDESRRQLWSDPETGRSPHVWGRAVGWFAMALVDSLDYLPAGHSGAKGLSAALDRLFSAMARYQERGSGLWHQVVDQGSRDGNYLETSVSAMLAYAFLKAARKGYAEPAIARELRASGEAALRGIGALKLRWDGGAPRLDGICAVAGLGGDPYRDGSFEYYASAPTKVNDPKGAGPCILALLEAEAAADPALASELTRAEEALE